jgi:hypothetical protein
MIMLRIYPADIGGCESDSDRLFEKGGLGRESARNTE